VTCATCKHGEPTKYSGLIYCLLSEHKATCHAPTFGCPKWEKKK
jgi:hypothetical protein